MSLTTFVAKTLIISVRIEIVGVGPKKYLTQYQKVDFIRVVQNDLETKGFQKTLL